MRLLLLMDGVMMDVLLLLCSLDVLNCCRSCCSVLVGLCGCCGESLAQRNLFLQDPLDVGVRRRLLELLTVHSVPERIHHPNRRRVLILLLPSAVVVRWSNSCHHCYFGRQPLPRQLL